MMVMTMIFINLSNSDIFLFESKLKFLYSHGIIGNIITYVGDKNRILSITNIKGKFLTIKLTFDFPFQKFCKHFPIEIACFIC